MDLGVIHLRHGSRRTEGEASGGWKGPIGNPFGPDAIAPRTGDATAATET
ncbi:hypothetical protein GCM10027174_33150 [Salinifilum aidingensis]